MASNLRVDQILPTVGTNVAIGTATGTVTLAGTTSGTFSGNLTGNVTVATGATISGSTNTIIASTNGSERVRIDSSGNVQIANGNLVFSTAGKGIDFSANPNAVGTTNELFNDYEVGTFTPTLIGHTAAGTVATGTVSGTYTKIGNTVIYHVKWNNITYSVKPTGVVKISGLAFATLNSQITGYVSQEGIDVGFTKAYGTNGGDIVLREYGSNVDVAFRVATSTGWDNYMEGGSTTFGVTGGTSWYGVATIIQTAST